MSAIALFLIYKLYTTLCLNPNEAGDIALARPQSQNPRGNNEQNRVSQESKQSGVISPRVVMHVGSLTDEHKMQELFRKVGWR